MRMMRAVLAAAVAVAGAPVFGAPSGDDQASTASSQRKVCTRVERRGGSRLSYQRVCLTEAQWRERLGADWRIELSGRNVEDDVDAIEARARTFTDLPSGTPSP
jgi:hypothetical protein